MNYRPRPSASGDSSSGVPQHLGADSFDRRPERYEIDVYYPTHFHFWQKPARLNRFSENYHLAHILDFLPVT